MPATAQAEGEPSPAQEHNPTSLLSVTEMDTVHVVLFFSFVFELGGR